MIPTISWTLPRPPRSKYRGVTHVVRTPVERLRSEKHADGLWHAAYPTATLALCTRPKEPQTAAGRPGRPDCPDCVRTARRFDLVDGSAPDWWKLR